MSAGRASAYSARDVRAFRIQMIVAFLSTAAIAGSRPTTTYRALDLGATSFEVGLVQSAFSVLPALTAVVIGRWIDRRGEGRTYFGGLVALSVGSVLSALAGNLVGLGLAQAVVGFGVITSLISGQASITARAQQEDWNKRLGSYAACLSLGQLVGPLMATQIQQLPAAGPDGEQWAFMAASALSLTAAILTLFIPPAGARPSGGSNPEVQAGFLAAVVRVLRRPGMGPAMYVSIAVASTLDVLAAYLPIYGEEVGLPVTLVGLLLSLRAGATMASRLMMDTTLRFLGWQRAMVACLAISAVMLGLIPTTAFPPALMVIMVCLGLSMGMLQPMTITWIASRAAKGERGTALAVRLTGNRGSLLLVPAVMGAVAGSAGVAAVFWILAGVVGLGSVIGRRAHGSNPTEGAGQPEGDPAQTSAKA